MASQNGFRLASIRRINVYQEVLNQIDEYLVANGLQPGDKLPSDRELAETLGVSRVVIRQALKVLEGFGRLEARQGSGTYVRDASYAAAMADLLRGFPINGEFLLQVVPVRIAIDSEVFSLAFEQRTPANLEVVRRALDERLCSLDGDVEEADLVFSFEAALGAICGNELLHRIQKVVHRIWVQTWASIGTGPADKRLFHREHEEIFAAFSRGDRKTAFELFRAHLDAGRVFRDLKKSGKLAPAKAQKTVRRRPAARKAQATSARD